MKRIILFLPILFAACTAAAPNPDLSGLAEGNVGQSAFGTLCNTPIECEASPVLTRLAIYRRRAANDLRKHVISVDSAILVQDEANRIRSGLNVAVKAGNSRAIDYWAEQLGLAVKRYKGFRR
ncbi:MAG: hypothetical protein ACU843_07480 [Gammaproteobacteria bacterium]